MVAKPDQQLCSFTCHETDYNGPKEQRYVNKPKHISIHSTCKPYLNLRLTAVRI